MDKLTDIGQIIALCKTMTNLSLDASCGFDRDYAKRWYEEYYLTGKHCRYVMKPGLTISSIEDGKVYRAFNTSDEKAVEFMESAEAYRDYFIDMQSEAVTIPEVVEPEPEPEVVEPEPEVVEPEPEVVEPTPEEIAEAAAKRSEAAKKAAATRAANKAAAEAAAAAEIKEFE